ncbi:MAG TPA: hypothetical protein DDZ39_02870, partial [Flavobacteriaceae bacterium]|nr:hypothetical protein [Flavobacteriaceae bacterium]
DVYKLLNSEEIKDLLEEMLSSKHHLVSLVGREMLNKASEELSGVVGSSSSYLNLYPLFFSFCLTTHTFK